MSVAEKVPDYADGLAAYHAAFADELKTMVDQLPITPGALVLDLACGDGTYAGWLAERVGPSGAVVALDHSMAYLEWARSQVRSPQVLFAAARLEQPPTFDGRFDLVWCAQSLFSLPDPASALQRLARSAKPNGVVAVLENDSLHQVLLPWPIEIELAIRQAELAGFAAEEDRPCKFYVGRDLFRLFRKAGLQEVHRHTWAHDRQAPLDEPTRAFLRHYLDDLRDRIRPQLTPTDQPKVHRLLDPDSDEYLLDDPDLAVTLIDHVVWGRTPRVPSF